MMILLAKLAIYLPPLRWALSFINSFYAQKYNTSELLVGVSYHNGAEHTTGSVLEVEWLYKPYTYQAELKAAFMVIYHEFVALTAGRRHELHVELMRKDLTAIPGKDFVLTLSKGELEGIPDSGGTTINMLVRLIYNNLIRIL